MGKKTVSVTRAVMVIELEHPQRVSNTSGYKESTSQKLAIINKHDSFLHNSN
jgi:hypothetical protein